MTRSDPHPDDPAYRALVRALRSVTHGTVEVVIHDGRIVEVVTTRKRRFPAPPPP